MIKHINKVLNDYERNVHYEPSAVLHSSQRLAFRLSYQATPGKL